MWNSSNFGPWINKYQFTGSDFRCQWAIAGVLGAYMFLFPKARIKTLVILFVFIQIVHIPAVIMLSYWILLQVLSAYAEHGSRSGGGIAWFAHIGGFVAGSVLIIMMKKPGRSRYPKKWK